MFTKSTGHNELSVYDIQVFSLSPFISKLIVFCLFYLAGENCKYDCLEKLATDLPIRHTI